jgi:hypothetical protein
VGGSLVLPESLETVRCQRRISHGRRDRAVAKVVLDSPSAVAVIGQLVAGGMPQHVTVDQEGEAGSRTSPRDHALIPATLSGAPRSELKMYSVRMPSGISRRSFRLRIARVKTYCTQVDCPRVRELYFPHFSMYEFSHSQGHPETMLRQAHVSSTLGCAADACLQAPHRSRCPNNLAQDRSTSMTDQAMSPLRRRMIEDMTSRSSRRAVSDDVTGRLALQTATLLLPL